jgi:hypothetical protein
MPTSKSLDLRCIVELRYLVGRLFSVPSRTPTGRVITITEIQRLTSVSTSIYPKLAAEEHRTDQILALTSHIVNGCQIDI